MAANGIIDKLRSSLQNLRPHLGTAYVTCLNTEQKLGRPFETGENYRFHLIESGDDPALGFAPRWQRRMAARAMANGEWICLVAYDTELDDLRVGHVWATFADTRSLGNGMLNVRLRGGEAYIWDLFIHPEHRRMSLGNAMGQALIDTFQPRGVEWGYTHVMADNSSSVIWHHMFGFDLVQDVNCIHAGDRFWMKVPFSASPRFGPMTRNGRHNQEPPQPPEVTGLLPPEWERSERN